MMDLYIKQKIFSWNDKFNVKDGMGNDRWYVEGEFFSFGKKLHVYDIQHNESVYIEQRLFSFMPRYEIYVGGQLSACLHKKFTFFRHEFTIEGTPLTLLGDFLAHDYELVDQNSAVMQMSKEWFTWGDSYHLRIFADQHELLCLGIALAVDCCLFDGNR